MSHERGILITGASTGIGRACAIDLAERGFRVFAGVRDERAGVELSGQTDGDVEPILLDITDPDHLGAAVETVQSRLSDHPLFGLLNNAGITINGPLEFVPPAELRRQLEVNVVAQLAVTQAFLPQLREAKGRVVLMGSVSGLLATPGMGPYCMSKSALEAMADVLRLELGPWGIRVSIVEPGTIETPIWQKGFDDWAAFVERAPAELSNLYGSQIDSVKAMVVQGRKAAKPPAVVAEVVAHAFTAARPRSRYRVGGHATQQRLLSLLPDGMRDWTLRRLLRL